MHWPRKPSFFESPKVVIPSMFDKPKAAYVEYPAYFGIGVNVVTQYSNTIPLRALSAILNSSLASWWFHQNGKKRGVGVDIGVSKLRKLPMPDTDNTDFSVLVAQDELLQILSGSKVGSAKSETVHLFESLIDACVMECYFHEHMTERDLVFHDTVAEALQDYNRDAPEAEQVNYLETVHQRLIATQIPERLARIPEASPDLLAVILKEGKV
ncbi:hypothetical protein N9V86_01520 [Opitutales bacterium]|nr:hypothetical protein [Opitutales bacterium]